MKKPALTSFSFDYNLLNPEFEIKKCKIANLLSFHPSVLSALCRMLDADIIPYLLTNKGFFSIHPLLLLSHFYAVKINRIITDANIHKNSI